MDNKLKKHQFLHVTSVEEDENDDNKCFDEIGENDSSDAVPLGLSGKAVCIQVCSIIYHIPYKSKPLPSSPHQRGFER